MYGKRGTSSLNVALGKRVPLVREDHFVGDADVAAVRPLDCLLAARAVVEPVGVRREVHHAAAHHVCFGVDSAGAGHLLPGPGAPVEVGQAADRGRVDA